MSGRGAEDLLSLDQYREQLRELVISHPGVLIHLADPIELAGGDMSKDFVDAKLAVEEPEHLRLAGVAMSAAATEAGVDFEAVGGLLVGAAPFTFAVAQVAQKKWFLVRKEPKGRGTNRWTEGTRITPGMRLMVVDDVITRGGSIRTACERVRAEGATVVFATCLVDRANFARPFFKEEQIPYDPILTYKDLGIDPVGGSDDAQAV